MQVNDYGKIESISRSGLICTSDPEIQYAGMVENQISYPSAMGTLLSLERIFDIVSKTAGIVQIKGQLSAICGHSLNLPPPVFWVGTVTDPSNKIDNTVKLSGCKKKMLLGNVPIYGLSSNRQVSAPDVD